MSTENTATQSAAPGRRSTLPAPWLPAILIALLVLFPFLAGLWMGRPQEVPADMQGIARLAALSQSGAAKFWQGMVIQMLILAIFAISYDLLLGYTGIISFGHAMFFGTGGYIVGILLKHFGWSLLASLLAVVVLALLQSLLIGIISLRVRGVYLAMVTLAFGELFFILAEASDFREFTGAEDGLHSIPVPSAISPTNERLVFYFLTLVVFLLVYALAQRLVNSPTGRVMVAIRENEGRAEAIGFNPFIFKVAALLFSGTLAGIAGALNALFNLSVTPSALSTATTINVLAMTILGGVGTLLGPVLGAALVHLLGFWLNRIFGSTWELLFGSVFVLIVIFLPFGIVGTWRVRSFQRREGWRRLLKLLDEKLVSPPGENRG